MTLPEVIKAIVDSETGDWHSISTWGSGSGPSYRGQWEISTVPGAGSAPEKWWMDRQEHSNVGVLKSNASITIAAGLEWRPDFKEDWTKQFPDPSATACYADVFFQGALVYRVPYVVVDGGRGLLPLPLKKDGKLLAPKGLYNFLEVIKDITGAAGSDDGYFAKSGMTLTDDAWPDYSR